MATEGKIRELFEKAKGSRLFAGLSEEAVRGACQDYAERSDEDIDAAIGKMEVEEAKVAEERAKAARAVIGAREKEAVLRQMEERDRQKEVTDAEDLLTNLFKE